MARTKLAVGTTTESRKTYMRTWRAANIEKMRAKSRAYYLSTAKAKRYFLQNLYGMTCAEYDALLATQGGICAICSRPDPRQNLAVDHNHKTGTIRGLLCLNCNHAIGLLEDSSELATLAAEYLTRWHKKLDT